MDIQGHIIDHWVEKMLDYLAKLPDVRCLSSEEQEKYDESIKAVHSTKDISPSGAPKGSILEERYLF